MKSSRLFQIVYELMSGERMTAPELARRLEVSVRTIYRDVEALCQAGVPIATGQGQGGGIRLMDGFVLDRTLMSPDEQERLLLAVKALASATGSVEKNESIFAEASAPTAIRHASPKLVEKSPIRIYGRFSKMSFLMFSCFFIVPAPSACSGPRRRVLPVL